MIKLRIEEILNARPALAKLVETNLPFSISLKLAKIVKVVNTEIELFNEVKNKILTQFEGDTNKIKEEIASAITIEVELYITRINVDEFENVRDLVISPKDIVAISPFLKGF